MRTCEDTLIKTRQKEDAPGMDVTGSAIRFIETQEMVEKKKVLRINADKL